MSVDYNEYEILIAVSSALEASDLIDENDQIIVDPDQTYNLVDENDVDTPALILELDDTLNEQASIKGSLLYGSVGLLVTGMIFKGNRKFVDYKPLIVALKHRVESAFNAIPKAKIEITRTKWTDFMLPNSIKGSGFVMNVKVAIHNFNYSL